MKLIFTVNEPGNYFHLLDSISQWSIHTTEEIRKYYQAKFPLKEKDKNLIEEYIKIRNKHGWSILDSYFYPAKSLKEVYKNLERVLDKEELSKLIKIIGHFKKNFKKIFIEWKPHLERRKQSLKSESKKEHLTKILNEIAHFYEASLPEEIYIHLLINPMKGSGGGANIHPKVHITLEPLFPKTNKRDLALDDLGTIAHESLHLIEHRSNKKKWKKFLNTLKKSKVDHPMLHESIADSIVPNGYLAHKYKIVKNKGILKHKNIKVTPKKQSERYNYITFRFKLAAHLYPLTKKQFEKNKSLFDGDYIKQCIKKYKEMKK